jgi:hypothetical protein
VDAGQAARQGSLARDPVEPLDELSAETSGASSRALLAVRSKPLPHHAVRELMVTRSTTKELALHLVRRLYEATDGAPKRVRLNTTGTRAKSALEFAVDSGWVVAEGKQDVMLTDLGRDIVRKTFS